MGSRKPINYVRTSIVEPFPVFYGHVSQKCRRANDPKTEGPFYAANSSWCVPFCEQTLKAKQLAAEGLRKDGYTVTVDVVAR